MLSDQQVSASKRFIQAALQTGIFQPVDPGRMIREEPVIAIACGDFTQEERWGHCKDYVAEKIQSIELHGGGLLLDPLSPEHQRLNHIPLIKYQIGRGVRAKASQGHAIHTFVAYYDWCCGVGVDHGMTAMSICRSAVHAKKFWKDPGNRMLPGNPREWKMKNLFYLHDLNVLDPDHPLRMKNPDAKAFTFYFAAKQMEDFLQAYVDEVKDVELVQ